MLLITVLYSCMFPSIIIYLIALLVGGFVHGPQDITKNSALCNRHGNRMNRSFNHYSSFATADIAHYAL